MAFQQINFASIPPMGRPALENALSTFMRGYAASQVPAQLRRQAQAAQIANAMANLKLQQEPQAFGADMQAKQLANAFQGMQNQEQPQKFSSDMASAEANRGLVNANTNRSNTLLPFDAKRGEIATDPRAKFNFMNTLVSLLSGGTGGTQNNAPTNAPAVNPQMGAPDNMQITPQGANNLVNSGAAHPAPPGYTANFWNQMMRTGLGFPAQTPDEKAQQQIDIAIKKQEAKTGMITPATATRNQQSLLASKAVVPMLQELKTMAPNQLYGPLWNPVKQKDYLTQKTIILDKLMSFFKVPNTAEAYQKLDAALTKSRTDSDKTYSDRIDHIISQMNDQGEVNANAANIIKEPFKPFNPSSGNSEKIYNMVTKKWE